MSEDPPTAGATGPSAESGERSGVAASQRSTLAQLQRHHRWSMLLLLGVGVVFVALDAMVALPRPAVAAFYVLLTGGTIAFMVTTMQVMISRNETGGQAN